VCVRVHIYITSGMSSKRSAVTVPYVETIYTHIYIYVCVCVCVCQDTLVRGCVCVHAYKFRWVSKGRL